MKKRLLLTGFIFFLAAVSDAQQLDIDNLLKEAETIKNDTGRLIRLRSVARIYAEINPDSSYKYSEQALLLARKLRLRLDEGGALREMGYAFLNKGNYPRALQTLLASLAILEDPASEKNVLTGKFAGDDELIYHEGLPHAQRLSEIAFLHQNLGVLYANSNNYERAWQHHILGRKYADESGNVPMQSVSNLTFNRIYLKLNKNDSALYSIRQAYNKVMESGYKRYLGSVLLNMGRTYAAMGNPTLANEYYRKCLTASAEQGYLRGVIAGNLLLADYYSETGKRDSSFLHIKDALTAAQEMDSPDLLLRTYTSLNHYYLGIPNNDSAVKYQGLIIKINDSLFNANQAKQFQNIDFDLQQKQQEIQAAKKEYENRFQKYLLLGGLAFFVIIALLLFRNNNQKQKANRVLETALNNLKSTQSQLIQSEKMASLGELTAGIAHEIQNPLNFVNNFSDVNAELIEEAGQKIDTGNISEAKSILADIKDNEQKINHHGRRAEAIVKSMLLHSRANSGNKELTDINTLCDEYLRLAYHGFRAKNKSFNAKVETQFDEKAGELNIIPQEIGRVILNLLNNAFYTVNEKSKQDIPGYEPMVTVSTKRANGTMEISVKDNGTGIPDAIKGKIFQPFFTAKPTGQGTGLGLSLSYDIVKAHGGEITVESSSSGQDRGTGKGTRFIIQIPLNS